MRVTFIGAGNVATVLGRKLVNAGHIIHEVYSRTPEHAERLAAELSASAVSKIDGTADFTIIAVSDDSLEHVSSWLKPVNSFVVHTAGSVSIDVLKDVSNSYGVLWPLQSIRKETSGNLQLPLLIDANNQWNKMKLTGFAQSFADSVNIAGDEERRRLHLAAVITNNFSNYLFALTEKYCADEGVDFKLLVPLLTETVTRLQDYSAAGLQTGPAIRDDVSTINKHRDLLHNHPELLRVYDFFTERIRERGRETGNVKMKRE